MAYLLLLELLLHLLTLFLQGTIFLLESFDLEFQENKNKIKGHFSFFFTC